MTVIITCCEMHSSIRRRISNNEERMKKQTREEQLITLISSLLHSDVPLRIAVVFFPLLNANAIGDNQASSFRVK